MEEFEKARKQIEEFLQKQKQEKLDAERKESEKRLDEKRQIETAVIRFNNVKDIIPQTINQLNIIVFHGSGKLNKWLKKPLFILTLLVMTIRNIPDIIEQRNSCAI